MAKNVNLKYHLIRVEHRTEFDMRWSWVVGVDGLTRRFLNAGCKPNLCNNSLYQISFSFTQNIQNWCIFICIVKVQLHSSVIRKASSLANEKIDFMIHIGACGIVHTICTPGWILDFYVPSHRRGKKQR